MEQNKNTVQTIFKVVKWFFAVIFIIGALSSIFKDGAIIAGIAFLLVGLLLLPPLASTLYTALPFLANRNIKFGVIFGLLVFAGATLPKKDKNNSIASSSPYEDYIKQTQKNLSQQPSDVKMKFDTMYSNLKATSTYKVLVEDKIVSAEYLPVLDYISFMISTYDKNKTYYGLESKDKETLNSSNGTDKLNFARTTVALGSPTGGGVPSEIIDVYERYKSRFKMYGEKGVLFDAENNNETRNEKDYDLSPFFGIIDPKNTDVLNKIYEAKRKGLSEWTDTKTEDAIYPYLATLEGYTAYVKQVYPESPYILKVDYEISAGELYNYYDANEVSADAKFKGKKLAVTGIVGDITKDFTGDARVSLEVDYFKTISCNFGDNTKAISQLSKGERVTVIGTCKGFIVKQVVLDNCELYK